MTGSGKTTVTLGLLRALRNRGVRVQPFKVGPDFIDAGLHEIAAGEPSHNLDGWMLTRDTNERLFARACEGKDVAVIEGVMGLFDGLDGASERASTAEMAKWLDVPVILVIDAHGMARSAAAMVHGFRSLDPGLKVSGILFNRVAGENHYRILADAVRDVPILGWLPCEPSIEIPERNLGLLTAKESIVAGRIRALGEFVERYVSIDAVLSSALPLRFPPPVSIPAPVPRKKRVALAHDKAFCFYYRANRAALEDAGAEIIEFSPLVDTQVPDADLLYLGGGYPELYRHTLEANVSMRESIRRFIESGKKFYAECGGLMYLAESIDGARMVGIVPTQVTTTDRLVDFGYCEVMTRADSILGPAGTTARGQQFHYSRTSGPGGDGYRVRQRDREYLEGFLFPNGVASYVHLHFLANPAIAENMLQS
jgi:cobyrinic acid a,c-diamide synthase